MNLKSVAIINPASADNTTGKKWLEIAELFKKTDIKIKEVFTTKPSDATTLTKEHLKDGYNLIISVGGDGTLNEVVNGFFEYAYPINENASLGIICQGTGGDFIKTVGIPKNEKLAVQCIKQNNIKKIDVGCARLWKNDKEIIRYFINIADVGIGGEVVKRVNNSPKRFGGFISFLHATLVTFWTYKNQRAKIIIDDEIEKEVVLNSLIIANGQYFGGGMRIVPHANLSDGVFDVLIMGDLTKKELYLNIAHVYKGTHLKQPKIEVLQAKSIKVFSQTPLLLDIDGEDAGYTPAEFNILPKMINVIC